jgi:Trm5-related predicted tRNA methylase
MVACLSAENLSQELPGLYTLYQYSTKSVWRKPLIADKKNIARKIYQPFAVILLEKRYKIVPEIVRPLSRLPGLPTKNRWRNS